MLIASFRVRSSAVALVVAFAGVVVTTPAFAESPCELRFEGSSTSPAWSMALRESRALVAKLSSSTTDCRFVSILPDADADGAASGATIVFATADGRTARRHIAEPRELLPMIQALLVVIGPMPAEAIAEAPAPALAPALTTSMIDASEDELPQRDVAEAAPLPRGKTELPKLLVGAGAGVKSSWPGDSVAGVGQMFAGMTLAHWEVAGFARWEIEHDAPTEASAPTSKVRYSALGGGAMVGRRQPLGPVVVIAGARAALFDAEVELAKESKRDGRRHDDFLDPRVGLYAGCMLSESSRVRVRMQIDGDAGVIVHRTELAELPAFPRWNLGISLGAEAGFLP